MFDKDFKEAIHNLTSIEKDKLILRLLKKDLVLANRLYFELVDIDTIEDKRAIISKNISKELERTNEHFFSLGYLLMDLRFISGKINDHLSITKDKYGEIILNLEMLTGVLELNKQHIINSKPKDSYTFCTYIIARTFKILLLIKAQHEDLYLDFRKKVEELGTLIAENPTLMKFAIHNGLDVNWLLSFEIPENIVTIHKQLRVNGFLK